MLLAKKRHGLGYAGDGYTFSSTTVVSGFVLWHLLSLDAPTVAVLWTVFTAALTHTAVSVATLTALALAVWILYAMDRILDSRQLSSDGSDLAGMRSRHLFHHRYRSNFLVAIAIACCGLGVLLPHLPWEDLRLYSIEGVALAGYFGLIHLSSLRIPKELFVGPFFAAAVFIPAISHDPTVRLSVLPFAVLFAGLCSLNCLYIHVWEHTVHPGGHWATTAAIRNLTGLSDLLFAVAFLLCATFGLVRSSSFAFLIYPTACAASVLLLRAIHQKRRRFSLLTLRITADTTLLTPLLFLPFLHGG